MAIPAEVQALIDSSGNTFHAKVARWLTSDGWDITISPYYLDQSQQKARELDLIAEKVWPIKDYGQWRGEVAVRLFVECKFLSTYSVLWFTGKDKVAIEEMLVATGRYRHQNTYTAKHHYLAIGDRVAKLFASPNARGHDSEPFYKALNQSLNALVSMRGQLPRAFTRAKARGGFKITLDFPVLVCNSFSQLYAADFAGTKDTEPIRDNFQLEVQYAYVEAAGANRNELFLIDVVEYDQLPAFVEAINEDAVVAGFFAHPD